MSNIKPYFPTVIETSVLPIAKHSGNHNSNNKCPTKQDKITFNKKTLILQLILII